MTNYNFIKIKKMAVAMLRDGVKGEKGNLNGVVKNILSKRKAINFLASKHSTPFYVIDERELKQSAMSFLDAFSDCLHNFRPYYAMKTNNHPEIIKRVLSYGFGLDVSSGWELERGLKLGAKDVIYTGPGKTEEEIEVAVLDADKVTINIDSFRELQKLDIITKKLKKKVNAGVRIFTKLHGRWNKFGIPIESLALFWKKASKCNFVNLQGIQVHMSWNKNAEPYANILKELATYLKNNFSEKIRKTIKFIDFGGGFTPYQAYGYYPWMSPQGSIIKSVANYFGESINFKDKYFIKESVPISVFAEGISAAIKSYIDPLVQCNFYAEPGRFISHKSMFIVARVMDIKQKGQAILDGGINSIGWERFEFEYYPVINITHPSIREKAFRLDGPLCTPLDHWGNYCYASTVRENDIMVISNQGAYTYTSAQNFIKQIPPVYILGAEEEKII